MIDFPVRSEVIVNCLDLVAFFLIVPELVGTTKLAAIYAKLLKILPRLQWWFGDREDPIFMKPSSILFSLLLMISLVLEAAGFDFATKHFFWIYYSAFMTLALVTASIIFLRWLVKKVSVPRAFILIGAGLFILARTVGIMHGLFEPLPPVLSTAVHVDGATQRQPALPPDR